MATEKDSKTSGERIRNIRGDLTQTERRKSGSLLLPKLCSVEGCENRAVGKGLCSKHYQRMWKRIEKKGSPEKKKRGRHRVQPKTCSIEGCDRKVTAKGLCTTHYQAVRRSKIRALQPKKVLKPRPKKAKGEFGERIRSVRGELSQTDFADAIGIKQAMVSRYESNHEAPSPRTMLKIAQFHGTSMEWLLTGKEALSSDSKKSKKGAKAGRPLSRTELVEEAVKFLDQIHLPETEAITAMLKEIYQDRELMKKVVLYYRYLTRELRTKYKS